MLYSTRGLISLADRPLCYFTVGTWDNILKHQVEFVDNGDNAATDS